MGIHSDIEIDVGIDIDVDVDVDVNVADVVDVVLLWVI